MKIKKTVFVLLTTFFVLTIFAQTSTYNVDLPQLLPASPEPSVFVKAGVGNANLSTGAVTANLPLYAIKIKDYTFPISLSYSSQGLKADEASSRVGLGWVLNATGVITRVVRGKPDEMALHLRPPADFSADTDSVYNYLLNAAGIYTGYDTQADEFQFNCNGYSGKFVLDSNYLPRITSTSNIKIDLQITVAQLSSEGDIGLITLTTPDGVKYRFGSNYEKTITHNIGQFAGYADRTKTAFFLDRIDLPTGEYILFNYNSITTRAVTGISQTLKLGKQYNNSSECSDCTTFNSYTNQEDRIDYQSKYLSSITTSNGQNINFSYEGRPDLSYDNRLKDIDVQGLKKYVFDYYDVPGTSTNPSNPKFMGRFFLMKVRDIKLQEVVDLSKSHDYVFTYYDLDQVPLPITFAQDYLGYYNGRSNNELIPPAYNSSGTTMNFSFRDPVWSAARIGTLSSIKYPTGGKEEYYYESNTQAKIILRDTWVTETMNGRGDQSGLIKVYNSDIIFIPRDQKAKFTLWATDADLSDGHTEDSSHWTVMINVYEGTNIIASRSSLGYNTSTLDVDLLGGHSYRWEMKVKNYTEIGYSTMNYDTASQNYYDTINVEAPGIRLRQVKSIDSVANKSHSKYYTYGTIERPGISTGACPSVYFKSEVPARIYCGQFNDQHRDCTLEIYSSSSTSDVYSYAGSGSLMYYNAVIESDDPAFANGGIEYNFFENDNGFNRDILLGEAIPNLQAGQYPTLSGMVFKTRTFNSGKQIIQDEENEYETLIDLSKAAVSYYVRRRYDTYIYTADRMDAFDVNKMLYGSYWIRLKTKTTKMYSNGQALTQKTEYMYGTPVNILPASIITRDSKNLEIKSVNKYPTDFPTEGANSKLIARNIITRLVEESSYRNGILLQQKHITNKDWFNDTTVLAPEKIQIKLSSSDVLHDALFYNKYDNSGNPLQLQKANDISIVYLWDMVHTLPLCEVKNASFEQVAFCSFEDEGNYGNWQLTSGSVNSVGFTGNYAFTGTLSKTVTLAGIYIVRLWTNSGATLNGTTGTAIKTVQGWTLYQWQLTNPSTISVSGTKIDDLRLYPQKAMMTTYTYRPFIGISSISDANNNVQYYEYDYMSRLSLVRDQYNNILKKYCYNYAGQPQDCGMDMTPLWQSTGVTRCKPCPANGAYISNIQQHQEKDNNQYSTTYNTTRWVDDGVSASCVPQADWQLVSSTCQLNGSSQNTGYQVRTEKDMNPCSATYNTTRQVTVYNTTACPLPVVCSTSNCSGNDRKCVNGVCETGTLVVVSSVYQKVLVDGLYQWRWVCTRKYCFSDGTYSTYSEQTYQTTSCSVEFCTAPIE